VPLAQEGGRIRGGAAGQGGDAPDVDVALALLPASGAGAGLGRDRGEPGPGHQVGRGREPAHVQADLGDQAEGHLTAEAGDLVKAVGGGEDGGVRAASGARSGGAVLVHAPGCWNHGEMGLDLVFQGADLGVQELDGAQVGGGGERVLLPEPHAGERLRQVRPLRPHRPHRELGQGARVPLAGDHRLDHGQAGLAAGQLRRDRRQLAQGVLQQLLQPLPAPGPVLGEVHELAGIDAHRADLRRRHERAPQQPHLGQPRDPRRVLLVRLRPPRQVPGLGGVDQLHAQPGVLQHREPDPPVIRRRLHRDQLHAGAPQLRRQVRDRRHRGRDLPRLGGPALLPRLGREPQARHPGRLRDIDPGHPLVPQLVILVFHYPGTHPLRLGLPRGHNPSYPGTRIQQAGCPGTRSAG
jgi:hypothetical protein